MRLLLPLCLLAAAACQRSASDVAAAAQQLEQDAPEVKALTPSRILEKEPALRTAEPAHDGDDALGLCPPGHGEPLDRAILHYDHKSFAEALACAAQAAAAAPDQASAHSEKAAALAALGRYDDARTAFSRALALDPEHPDALLGAADLYISRLPSSRDFSELGLAYATRGHGAAKKAKDRQLAAQFAMLEATGLNNIGRGEEAIVKADEAIAASVDVAHARYEKASALYELCRFPEAKKEFVKLLKDPEREAWAHHFLGLLAERENDGRTAEKELAVARKLAPEDFPEDVSIDVKEFAMLVESTLKALPHDMQTDVKAIPISTQDLPDLDDLVSNEPALSPAILGLFRGPSLGDPCPADGTFPGACRAIVIYRKNLARATKDRAELEKQVRITLIHEIGHLRGEDDVQLSARGLE